MSRGLLGRLDRIPIRWRLALTSAALTLVILLLFAVVVGTITTNRIQANFDDDLRLAATELASPDAPGFGVDAETLQAAATGRAVVRVVTVSGDPQAATRDAPDLGPPTGEPRDVGSFRVVSRPLRVRPALGGPPGERLYVQYAKPKSTLQRTIGRVRLFLGLGVLGGTALALLAGVAVARRAMAPVSGLTSAAQRIARTRDPTTALPRSEAEDEVSDLARTLEEMLAALDASRSETEAALSRQREFIADASHELRTPLTSVLANLELLETGLDGEQAEIAESALRSSQRMRRLVGDLLLLARADAGRKAPRRPCDLAAVAGEALAELAPLAGEHDLELDAKPGPEGLTVEGSPDDLHRLVLNLVENAIRHTPAGSSIRVTLRADAGDGVLEVADDGPGIPPDLRARLFERFVRADAAGSGLGLAIVQAVAETHGGSVELAASEHGARFLVRLPLSSGSQGPTPQLRPAAPSAGA